MNSSIKEQKIWLRAHQTRHVFHNWNDTKRKIHRIFYSGKTPEGNNSDVQYKEWLNLQKAFPLTRMDAYCYINTLGNKENWEFITNMSLKFSKCCYPVLCMWPLIWSKYECMKHGRLQYLALGATDHKHQAQKSLSLLHLQCRSESRNPFSPIPPLSLCRTLQGTWSHWNNFSWHNCLVFHSSSCSINWSFHALVPLNTFE